MFRPPGIIRVYVYTINILKYSSRNIVNYFYWHDDNCSLQFVRKVDNYIGTYVVGISYNIYRYTNA